MYTDFEKCFILSRVKVGRPRKLFMNLTASRVAYWGFEIDFVGLACGNDNFADAVSKLKHIGVLSNFLECIVNTTPVEPSIMCTNC